MATAKALAQHVARQGGIQPSTIGSGCAEDPFSSHPPSVVQIRAEVDMMNGKGAQAISGKGDMETKTIGFFEWLLISPCAVHDEAMLGLRCVYTSNCEDDSNGALIMNTVRRLPKHLLLETLDCFPSTILLAILMGLGSLVHHAMVRRLPGYTGPIKGLEQVFAEKGMVGEALLLDLAFIFLNNSLIASVCALFVLPSAPWKPFHVLLKIHTPIQCLLSTGKVMAGVWQPSLFAVINLCFRIQAIIAIASLFYFPVRAVGRRNGNPYMASTLCCLTLAFAISFNIFFYALKHIVVSTDVVKVLMLAVVLPVQFHGLLGPAYRMYARAIRNIDPSTLWLYTAMPVVFERVVSRLVMYTLVNPSSIVVTVLLKSAVIMLLDQMHGESDYRLYRWFGLLAGVTSPLQNVHVPRMNLFSDRYETFYPLSMNMIFSVDVALIATFSLFWLFYNCESPDGQLLAVGDVMIRMFMQMVCEYARHISAIMLLVVQSKVDYVTLSLRKSQYFAFCLFPQLGYTVAVMMLVVIPDIIFVAPSDSKAPFVIGSGS